MLVAKRERTPLFLVALAVLMAIAVNVLPAGQAGAQQEPSKPATQGPVVSLTVDGAIGPAVVDYVSRGLEHAVERGASLVVIRMDTPGGLDSAMRDIVKTIVNSAIPVATYVAPGGARAASAGTYILYASHIAAMAPGTNLGAATPVQMGGPSPAVPGRGEGERGENESGDGQAAEEEAAGPSGPEPASNETAMRRKAVNDAVAYIRGLAELRSRNADWAEKAVREGVSLPAAEALEMQVIDLMADSDRELLDRIDGMRIEVLGNERALDTKDAPIEPYEADWRTRLLGVIANPNVAYILMMIGIYGLIFEFANPGAIVPGTVGAICLLLALYALQLLPVNYAGIGLLLLGVGLMVAEAFQPSFGVLGIGGVVAFLTGSLILIETEAPGFGLDLSVVIVFTVLSALIFTVVVGMALRARSRPVVSGAEQMMGLDAVVVEDFERRGRVRAHSEIWRATSEVPLKEGQKVRVTGIDGLTLAVEPKTHADNEEADR